MAVDTVMHKIPRWIRKLGWVLTGLLALAVTGWAVTPHQHHSTQAVEACADVGQVVSGLQGTQTPPGAVMTDLVRLAPTVTDAGLSGPFRAFYDDYRADNVQGGLAQVNYLDDACNAAGLAH